MIRYSSLPILPAVFAVSMGSIAAAQIQNAPPPLAATLVVKLAAFEKTISGGGDVSVYVLGDANVAAEMRKGVGASIGQSRLARVTAGADLPSERPSILFIGSPDRAVEAVVYSRAQDVMSITARPDLMAKGITLGVGVGNDGKPKVLINLFSGVEENLTWNPAIFKLAKTVQ
jgi:hypothetical protein